MQHYVEGGRNHNRRRKGTQTYTTPDWYPVPVNRWFLLISSNLHMQVVPLRKFCELSWVLLRSETGDLGSSFSLFSNRLGVSLPDFEACFVFWSSCLSFAAQAASLSSRARRSSSSRLLRARSTASDISDCTNFCLGGTFSSFSSTDGCRSSAEGAGF